ncbi:hypothetical protein PGN35_025315 [Nodosilinea sp. PGN35]|uniref:hypothetical protein n=1 Tax=Nodosilinea sp. PGN35 TaxID=3020489 RepID=UPI0023B287F3|nr:hypothetical protein [Nodosilinea sp. TSF1-S3]MDF0367445.1 hypothetical protein [Nodosilinea sp. TSF1-S3]
MADFLEPLLPIVNSDPDMSRAELTQACEDALLRAKVLEDYLRGDRPEDDFNDLLREERWDVDAYWRNAECAVDSFIQAGIVPEALEFLDSGLVIPRYGNA